MSHEISLFQRARRAGLVALAATVAAGGCSSSTLDPANSANLAVAQALPEPELADMYAAERDVRFGPGDTLSVSVLGAPDLSGERTVDGRGMVDFPLIGEVAALGRTSSELAQTLEAQLGERFLRNPQVSVSPKTMASQQVTVLGGVGQPGRYAIDGSTSLRDAIAQAQGISEVGADKDIVVFRTVNGQRMAARFDMREINGGRMDDPLLFPNDRVFVATNRSRQLLRDLAPLTPLAGIFYQIF